MFKLVKNKFIFFSTLFVVITVSLPVIFLLFQMKSNFEERSFLLMESIFNMLSYRVEHAMELGEDKIVQDVISDFSHDNNVERLRIVSSDGHILYSNASEEITRKLSEYTPENFLNNNISARELFYSYEGEKYIALEPIVNKESCMKCHGKEPIIAYLSIESDATQSEINFYTGLFHILMFGLLIIIVLAIGLNYIFRVFINNPLEKFLTAIDDVEQGNLKVRIEHSSEDEFGIITNHFNRMLKRLRESKDEIEELNFQKLQRADRLVTVGELTAGIAHEINNYSAIIMARADYLRISSQTDHSLIKYYDDLNVMVEQLERLSSITREVLKYSKKPSENFKQLNLIDVIEGSVGMLKPFTTKRNISIYKRFKPNDHIWVYGDFIQLEQVFNNLINNSIDAIDDEGSIMIEIVDDADFYRVIVEDNGPGMDSELTKQIFLPFFTTKSSERGTGLGLYIVKNICAAHKAEIVCNSNVGVGTKFILSFNKYGVAND